MLWIMQRSQRQLLRHFKKLSWIVIIVYKLTHNIKPDQTYDSQKTYNIVLLWVSYGCVFNTLTPRQNGRHFADDTFKRIFMNENVRISINILLKFVPKGLINNIPALVQIMAWRRPGDKPLSESMMVSLLMHICVTLPQWVNRYLGWNWLSNIKIPCIHFMLHHG